jgi:hypothetical protein
MVINGRKLSKRKIVQNFGRKALFCNAPCFLHEKWSKIIPKGPFLFKKSRGKEIKKALWNLKLAWANQRPYKGWKKHRAAWWRGWPYLLMPFGCASALPSLIAMTFSSEKSISFLASR